MKLFMFAIGGDYRNSNVELHDVRFATGETEAECYPELHRQWWGDAESLHLDAWGELAQADGYDITISAEPVAAGQPRLFFVNLGGYNGTEFGELHKNLLLVAEDAKAAVARALAQVQGWNEPHKDGVFEVDKALDLSADLARRGLHLHLRPASAEQPFRFSCGYIPIGRMPETYPAG
ncbi:DUF1543 domain-containing protein [Acidocella aromatica]|uniref:DUF1543 domain-containing protein n=1 Tax=Acidocella aromatica TaxID=1303579 RepID=A0A840VND4_9PROT|nr:hypothetical protein [Acidocella aromatica]